MSFKFKFAVQAALILVAASWASSASALIISGSFSLIESVPATSTTPGEVYAGKYTTVDFDETQAMAGDIVELSDISIQDLFGGFSFSDFIDTPLAVLGTPSSVIALSGIAVTEQTNPFQIASLSLGIPFGNPGDATFGAAVMNGNGLGFHVVHGHQAVPEPTIFALLGGGLLAMGAVGTRRRRTRD